MTCNLPDCISIGIQLRNWAMHGFSYLIQKPYMVSQTLNS